METPQSVVTELEKLYEKIDDYLKTRIENNEMMTTLANSILQEVIGTQSTLMNLWDCLIKYALDESQEDAFAHYKDCLKEKVTVSDEQWRQVNEKFYRMCQ